jgi:ribonuclease J
MSALARMASHDHHLINIQKGDTVVISAKPVPGNERSVWRTINRLFAAGADVIYESIAQVHVSGHASAEELKMLLNLVRPRFFMPVHGEYRHLHFHSALARSVGMEDENIFILENGDVLELDGETACLGKKVQAGMTFVDGLAIGDFQDVVLRDRHHLANDGMALVVVAVSEQDGRVAAGPEIVFRGFVHSGDLTHLAEQLKMEVVEALRSDELRHITDPTVLKLHVHDLVQRSIYKETRRRPMVLPVVVDV